MPQSNSPSNSAQVAIIGGGPVGLGLAVELGQRGVRCVLIERFVEPQPIPKGQNLTQRTMEHFHFWGAENELRAARTIPPEYGIGGLTAYGSLLSGYAYDWLQRDLVAPYYYARNERLPQYATEAVLRRRVAQLETVRTLYGWAVEHVSQDADGVSLDLAERNGSGRRVVRAEFAVGCDGSRSTVREQAGITQTKSDHDRLMCLVVFRSTDLHRLLERFAGKSYYNVLNPELKGYWQFFGRVDLGSTWFFHAPVPLGTTAETFDFRAYLQKAVGADFEMTFEYIGFWELRVAIADAYRQGRIFIAGDSAHSHPPYGGYGVNSGFEDAANLGWKLAAVFEGWGGPRLLDSYGEERRPVFQSTARDFIEKSISEDGKFLQAFDPARDIEAFEAKWRERSTGAKSEVNAFEPHYEGSSIICSHGGSPGAVGHHSFLARPGHHLAPRPLSDGRDVYEALGDGFTLLAFDADQTALGAFQTAATQLNVPLTVVRDSRSGGREQYGASLILVRPDQFVAWVSDDSPIDARSVLGRATGL